MGVPNRCLYVIKKGLLCPLYTVAIDLPLTDRLGGYAPAYWMYQSPAVSGCKNGKLASLGIMGA